MAEIVLFHHAQGLTDGVIAFADRLRSAGHTVHTPDLYEGHTFPTLDAGMGYARSVGFDKLLDAGVAAGEALPAELVYAGFSLGVMPAQKLAQTRASAQGAVLFDACIPLGEFGAAWPHGVPVQVHGMEDDPYFAEEGGDIDAARQLVASTDEAELFLYPGNVHLFADSSLTGYDAAATEQMLGRVLAFLSARVGAAL